MVLKEKMALTLENMLVGALKGQVLDADGTTVLWDMYSIFGFTQDTHFFNMDTAATSVDLKQKCILLKRAIKTKLGGRSFTRVRVKCSADWFDKFVGHNSMKAAWDQWQNGAFFRQDQSTADFEFAGVVFQVYLGGTSAGDFIPAGLAFAYPEGVPRMFQTAYCPADYMETVNTIGLPLYAKQELMRMNKGVALEAQSNPLNLCTKPRAVIKLTK